MSERSTVLGEYEAIKRDRLRREKSRKLIIVGVVLLSIIGMAAAGYFMYKNSTMSWNDQQWYQRALEIWPKQKDNVSYWSVSSNIFIRDEDDDYDNSCVESFSMYYNSSAMSYKIDLYNYRVGPNRVEHEESQTIELIYENKTYGMMFDTDGVLHVSKSKPEIVDKWLSEYALDNIFLPELQEDDIQFSYRNKDSDDIYLFIDPERIPEAQQRKMIREMFGNNDTDAIITSCSISVSVKENEITGWSIDVDAIGDQIGTVYYSRSYYMAADDGFYNHVDSGELVLDWNELDKYVNIRELNYWKETPYEY